MSNLSAPPRIVFFGMLSHGSAPALQALLDAGHDVRALVMPGEHGDAPVVELPPPDAPAGSEAVPEIDPRQAELIGMAWQAGIPVLAASTLRHRDAVTAIARHDPDLIVVSCFSLRVPKAVLELPRLGCLNVHPSLLPRWRGPEPVFWALRAGDEQTGVTIHFMDAGWDTGPIVGQRRLPWPAAERLPEIERSLAEAGAALLIETIADLCAGNAHPLPQDAANATHAPAPKAEDYVISTGWSAYRAYRFARAVAPAAPSLSVRVADTDETIPVQDALSWSPSKPAAPVVRHKDTIEIAFSPGMVRFLAPAGMADACAEMGAAAQS
ncbi:MAG TPA: methionyl-tRNA formyltransferase [Thermomicrobiales bacterium]